jgi:hypothetical protein
MTLIRNFRRNGRRGGTARHGRDGSIHFFPAPANGRGLKTSSGRATPVPTLAGRSAPSGDGVADVTRVRRRHILPTMWSTETPHEGTMGRLGGNRM